MDTALAEISSFIQIIPPFDLLPRVALEKLVKKISICYVRSGEKLPPKGIIDARLYILRKGTLIYTDKQGYLVGKYSEGDICSVFCRPAQRAEINVNTGEDTLLYSIVYEDLLEVTQYYPQINAFFMQTAAERLKEKMAKVNDEAILNSSLANSSVSDFYHAPVATISSNANIQDAAIKMTELGFSCLVIVEDEKPVGLITDKDIRRRCVAQGLPSNHLVSEIMTKNMTTLDIDSSAYDALMVMISKHIHHLPITKSGMVCGMVTVTDLMNNEGHNAVNITSIIHKANSVDELIEMSKLLPKLQIRMAKLGTTADHVGKSISAITMAFTIRLIEMAEQLYGSAPVPYAWLAAGSQARQEQLAHSDQDNALIISNEMKPEDDVWFKNLAKFVSDGLASCGFVYCPGDIMATNDKWRQPQKVWNQYFEKWVNTPDPSALLNSCVFFDLTTIYGDVSLLDEVRKKMLVATKRSTLFIAHLSRNALNIRPPLGFFRDFVLIQDGENKPALDLKLSGITPIIDLARIYALAQGISASNTLERLQQAAGTSSLSKISSANLIDAYQFLTMLRMQHQAQRLQAGKVPNNFLSPKKISKLEREHLKDAFKVIKTMQDSRQSTY